MGHVYPGLKQPWALISPCLRPNQLHDYFLAPTSKATLWFLIYARQANCNLPACMAYEVIRITCHNDKATTRLILEGKLAGACVEELDRCWQLLALNGSTLLVDLTSVSFIDDRGKQLLKRMHDRGAKLVSSGLMSKCLIAEISQ